jgi:hypothetical protein
MKIAVLNYPGTVGKTTIAAHLLSPCMNTSSISSIETVNKVPKEAGFDVEKKGVEQFQYFVFEERIVNGDTFFDLRAPNGQIVGMWGIDSSGIYKINVKDDK